MWVSVIDAKPERCGDQIDMTHKAKLGDRGLILPGTITTCIFPNRLNARMITFIDKADPIFQVKDSSHCR